MSRSVESVWGRCLEYIQNNVNDNIFNTWFKPINPVRLEEDVLTIQVPSLFFYEWLEEHYVDLLHKTIKRELGSRGRLEYNIIVDNTTGKSKEPYTINIPTAGAKRDNPDINVPVSVKGINPFAIPGIRKVKIDSNLNPSYTFENYVEGDCNRLARAAGMAVASEPAETSFNPLFMYGGVGLGKTHLGMAIGNKTKELHPRKTVLYVSSEKFTNQFIDSLKNNSVNDFLHIYQLIDVLIMDDVQFLSGKERTQDIFFHIFNHLQQNKKQIILTSDRAPNDLSGIEERIISRFKWGLSTDLQKPDYETRTAILRSKMYKDGIELPDEVVEFISHNVDTNIRELEGALISMLARISLDKREPDIDMAKEVLKNFVKRISSEVTIESIQKMVSEYYSVAVDQLKSATRKREITQARQISMYFAKKYTNNSLKSIGSHFGGRDHSTVIHSCTTVKDLIDTDKKIKKEVDELEKKIQVGSL